MTKWKTFWQQSPSKQLKKPSTAPINICFKHQILLASILDFCKNSLLLQLPQKIDTWFKVLKTNLKIILLQHKSKSMTNSVEENSSKRRIILSWIKTSEMAGKEISRSLLLLLLFTFATQSLLRERS